MEYKRLTQAELDEKLNAHEHWLNMDCPGWEKMWQGFTNYDLSGLDLSGRDLNFTKFSFCKMDRTNFDKTLCRGTKFNCCDILNSTFMGMYGLGEISNTTISNSSFAGADLYKTVIDNCLISNTAMGLESAKVSESIIKGKTGELTFVSKRPDEFVSAFDRLKKEYDNEYQENFKENRKDNFQR